MQRSQGNENQNERQSRRRDVGVRPAFGIDSGGLSDRSPVVLGAIRRGSRRAEGPRWIPDGRWYRRRDTK